jgi:hypothetical protein
MALKSMEHRSKKNRITIIKVEAPKLADPAENPEITDLNLADLFSIPRLHTNKSPQLADFCNRDVDALTDIEQGQDIDVNVTPKIE